MFTSLRPIAVICGIACFLAVLVGMFAGNVIGPLPKVMAYEKIVQTNENQQDRAQERQ